MFRLTFYFIFTWTVFYISSIKCGKDYGMYHYTFDDDPLVDQCTKENPLAFQLMYDFLSMIRSESSVVTQKCVLNKEGPGLLSPPAVARTIFAATTILYNTYARYSKYSLPATLYDGWERYTKAQNVEQAPDCVYIYGLYHIARYLMPEQTEKYGFKQNYEEKYKCNLTMVPAETNSEFALVQRDVDKLISKLKDDGFNQGGCFADTTNFKTVNPPCTLDNRTTVELCRSFTTKHNTSWNYGEFIKTGFVDKARTTVLSQSQRCKPFSLGNLADYLAPPYFKASAFENGTMMDLRDQFLELTQIQSQLDEDNEKPKIIAEHWADGPKTTATPGHWQSITLNIIRRLCYDNEKALKLLFSVSAATYDAGIAAWQNKRLYNSVRPAVFIPTEFIDRTFQHQFVGMYCPFQDIEGWQWSPYQEDHVITPEFQEYISGHSTFSRAASYILEKFTGSKNVPGNLSVTIKAGQSMFQPQCAKSHVNCSYVTCRVNSTYNSENNYIPMRDVKLGPWKTYRDIANEASISRKYGGIHIASGDIQGRNVGQYVGETVWNKLTYLFNDISSTTTVATSASTKIGTSNRFPLHLSFCVFGFSFLLLNRNE